MADRAASFARRAYSFGPVRLLPAQEFLLTAETPGSDILVALIRRSGEPVREARLDTYLAEEKLEAPGHQYGE